MVPLTLTIMVELEGFMGGINGHRNRSNSGNGLLEGVFTTLTDVNKALVVSTRFPGVVPAVVILWNRVVRLILNKQMVMFVQCKSTMYL